MKLTARTVTLKDVAGIAVVSTRGATSTLFDATIDGVAVHRLQVPGKPALRDGMKVTALLRDANDWHTVEAWIDHGSGAIIGRRSRALISAIATGAVGCVALAWLSANAWGDGDPLWPAFAVLGLLFGAFAGWQTYRWRAVRADEKTLRQAV
jgi:hypothetical protein